MCNRSTRPPGASDGNSGVHRVLCREGEGRAGVSGAIDNENKEKERDRRIFCNTR